MAPSFNAQEYCSSDVEPDEPAPPTRLSKAGGQRSIENMVANAEAYRNASKTKIRRLEFGSGSPLVQERQSLWINRFNRHRTDVLGQSDDVPFTCHEVIRFLDTILQAIVRQRDKPALSHQTIWQGIAVIIAYGTWKWRNFDFGPYDAARVKQSIQQSIDSGILMKGAFRERASLGFATLSRLVRNYLQHVMDRGTGNYDHVINRTLAVVLQSALACRSGDIAVSKGYSDRYCLRFEHVELFLLPPPDDEDPTTASSLQHLRAIFTLAYTKCHKNEHGRARKMHLQPLLAAGCHHLCPVLLLLIDGLRRGLFEGGNTMQAVLDHAAATTRRQIVWKDPQLPVLLGTTPDGKPAGEALARLTLKEMGLVSGVLSRVTTHALRRGTIRDMTAMQRADRKNYGPEDMRRQLGHNLRAMANGVTDGYIPDTEADLHSQRADVQPTFQRDLLFAAPGGVDVYATVKAKVPEAERSQYVDADTTVSRLTATRLVRADRLVALASSAPTEPRQRPSKRKAEAMQMPSPLPPPSQPARNTRTPLRQLAPNSSYRADSNGNDAPAETPTASWEHTGDGSPTKFPRHLLDPALRGDGGHAQPPRHVPDPALRGDDDDVAGNDEQDEEDDPVLEVDLDRLEKEVFARQDDGEATALETTVVASDSLPPLHILPTDIEGPEHDQVAELLATEAQDGTTLQQRADDSAMAFIDAHSRYNTVQNEAFARAWGRGDAAAMAALSVRGNSRDEPTPFLHKCSVSTACPYANIRHDRVREHEASCNVDRATLVGNLATLWEQRLASMSADELKARTCTIGDCTYVDKEEGGWTPPVEGEPGKTPKVDGSKRPAGQEKTARLVQHQRVNHGFEPTTCGLCDSPEIFKSNSSLQLHRRRCQSPGSWPALCRYPDCDTTTTFDTERQLKRHLATAHDVRSPDGHQYLPPLMEKVFVPRQCWMEDCQFDLKAWKSAIAHLQNKHRLSYLDATQAANANLAPSLQPKARRAISAAAAAQVQAKREVTRRLRGN
ncbi:uncharacterized protein LTR77_002775 [Saxophila tyrrhenica]|uniref:C2H2-type domain-containing protein n=1 Tax=Saxophila tyrrhenica TaxID=1690608 RepID=A0AAV9PJ76_9PEZI|nr:hypothetical protein LTR77_002775 [Saxophila tyrrhenica]